MLNLRTRTARDIVTKAGRWPSAAAAVALVNLMVAPSITLAQPAQPAAPGHAPAAKADAKPEGKPRDPMASKSDTKVAVSEHMTVDLHVKDEDLANVLELLSIQTQKNIIASKSVGGKVTATLYGVTFYQALDAILHVNGFGYIENGNFIYVYTQDELKAIEAANKKRVSKVIRLNYLNANDAKEFVSPLLSKDGGEIKVNEKTKDFSLSEKLPVGKDDYSLGATLVVIDFEENIFAIEELVKQLDTRPAQVLVEATILQTSLNEANAFGVDFSVIGDLNFGDFINIGGPLGAANGLIKGGTGASGQGFSPIGDRGNAITSNPGNTSGPGTFKLGVLAGDVSIFLKMLDQVTDSVILSNPKILTLNRQPSRVLVGKRVGYLQTTSTETSTTQTVNFLDTGTQLYFRPFVSSEGEVRMELKPQVSAAEIRDVTNASGATVTIPDEVTQEIVTNVNVKDGQTIVLGGLFTETSTFSRRQVPWVGDIPILGAAFRGHDDSTARSEIIFLVTPTIINDAHLGAQAERYAGHFERMRTGIRQSLLPWSRDRMTDALNVEAEKLATDGEYDKALWNVQRSLALNAKQPQAYQLRERISGEKERWTDRSVLSEIVSGELAGREANIQPAPSYQHTIPWGSRNTVREPANLNPTTGAGSKKTIIGATEQENPAPIASVDELHSSNTNSSNNTNSWQPPAANAQNSADTQLAQADGVYRATMQEGDATSWSIAAVELTPAPATVQATQSNTQPVTNPTTEVASTNTTATNTATNTNTAAHAPVENTPPANLPVANAAPSTTHESPHETPVAAAVHQPEPTTTTAATTTPVATAAEPNNALESTNAQASASAALSEIAADNDAVAVLHTLTALRGQIELYGLMNSGKTPTLGADIANAWKPLQDAKLIENAPVNSFVGGENADKVMIADGPDAAFHTNYGWVFNPKTGQLWAAGFDSNDQPLDKATALNTNAAPAANKALETAAKPAETAAPTAKEIATAISPSTDAAKPKVKGKSRPDAKSKNTSTASAEEQKH